MEIRIHGEKSRIYIPTNIVNTGRIDISVSESAKKWSEERPTWGKKIIKEGIDFVRMARPKTSLQSKLVRLMPATKKNIHETS
jgi:hypothetical protein